jgi:hypothetical protein
VCGVRALYAGFARGWRAVGGNVRLKGGVQRRNESGGALGRMQERSEISGGRGALSEGVGEAR